MAFRVILFFLLLNFKSFACADEFIETLENTFLVNKNISVGITKIVIDPIHKKIKIWESCIPKDCDWGIVKYVEKNKELTAIYALGDIKKIITISLVSDALNMNAEVAYFIDNKIIKTVNYQLKSQKNRPK